MKKFKLFSFIALTAFLFSACSEDYTDWAAPQSYEQGTTLTASFADNAVTAVDTVNLNETEDSVVKVVSITAPTLSDTALSVSKYVLYLNNTYSYDITADGYMNTDSLQALVETLYGKAYVLRSFAVYVAALVTDGISTIFVKSNVDTLKVYPVKPDPIFYMVGALQGWSNTAKTCLFYPTSATVFTYTTTWPSASNLKFWDSDGFGDWNACYGSETDGSTATSGTIVNSGAGAITVPEAGVYTFTFDYGAMTYTWTKESNQSPTSYTSIGIVGGFTNWADGADITMTEVTPHNWYAADVAITATELKFRADGAWTTSWGVAQNIADTFYGTAQLNGNNMTVPAGIFDVYFNDITGQFAFISK